LAVGSPFPDQMLLQHAGTVLIAAWAGVGIARGDVSAAGTRGRLAFLLLHAFAARWIYSYVPYDDWARAVSGRGISEVFGWRRNHFDRLVHFLFGVLVARGAADGYRRKLGGFGGSRRMAVQWVATASLAYELFEWGLTMVLSPDDAEGYNGQQGDVWDAHKDMAFAVVGSIVWAVGDFALSRLRRG